MTGVMFDYSVRVRRIYWKGEGKDRKEFLDCNWYSFSSVIDAVDFCRKHPLKTSIAKVQNWIIEICLEGQTLERIDPFQWKFLARITKWGK